MFSQTRQFTVDTQPPTLMILDIDTNLVVDFNNWWSGDVTLEFVCDDEPTCSSSTSGTFTVFVNKLKLKGSTLRIKGAKVKIK